MPWAAYIDLNPVRAGMVDRPEGYRFCGLGEACAGNGFARRGYAWLGSRRAFPGGDRFSDYRAYVQRLLVEEGLDAADGEGASSAARSGRSRFEPVLIERAGAMGSFGWVKKLCAMGGCFGFRRTRQPKQLAGEPVDGADLHAARQWCRERSH